MRRILAFLLSILLCISFSLASAEGVRQESFEDNDFSYVIMDDGTLEIIEYRGAAERLEIPSEIAGRSVSSIGYGAFSNCTNLVSVDIPNSVNSIGEDAFCECANMSTIKIPNSVTSIGEYAFYACDRVEHVRRLAAGGDRRPSMGGRGLRPWLHPCATCHPIRGKERGNHQTAQDRQRRAGHPHDGAATRHSGGSAEGRRIYHLRAAASRQGPSNDPTDGQEHGHPREQVLC